MGGRRLTSVGDEESAPVAIELPSAVVNAELRSANMMLAQLETSRTFLSLAPRVQEQVRDYFRDEPSAVMELSESAVSNLSNTQAFIADLRGRDMPEPVRNAFANMQNAVAVILCQVDALRHGDNALRHGDERDIRATRDDIDRMDEAGGTVEHRVELQTAINNLTALREYLQRADIDDDTRRSILESPDTAYFIWHDDINAIKRVLEPLGIVFDTLEFQRILGQISGETERFARQVGMSDDVIEQARERSMRFRTREEYAPSRETRRRPTTSQKESDVAKAALGEIIQQMAITIQQGHREEERERIRRRGEQDARRQVEESEREEPEGARQDKGRKLEDIRRALAGQVGDETARQIEDAIERGLIRPRTDSHGPAGRGQIGERSLDDIVPRRVYTTVNGQDFEDDSGLLQGLRR